MKSSLVRVALLAFAAMFANDVLMTSMVVFEAHYNALLAGLFDVLGWVASLTCSALAIEEIIKHGWRSKKSLTIIAAISLANFSGCFVGVALGRLLS